jgi:lantibiotic transport system permease protein
MSFAASYRAELLKTKRTFSFWLSLLGAGFIPALLLAGYLTKPDATARQLKAEPWNVHFFWGFQAMGFFLLPMFVVLLCALVPQIEFKNNTWKQVFASPQSYGQVYFSKLVAIHTMLLFFFACFNVFMLGTGLIASLVHTQLPFSDRGFDLKRLLELNLKMYISTLGVAALQYWLSLRFKNFVLPVGIGLALLIMALIASRFQWEHIYKVPFAHPGLTLQWMKEPAQYWLQPHEWNAIVCFVLFTAVGFLDVKYRKEKG